ncbi:MAG: hypothetical protein ABMB14_10640 [Myxococcota bacterium]
MATAKLRLPLDRRWWGLAAAVALGCSGKDSDDDGLSDREEAALGLDPADPDSDDDTLKDGAEGDLGTDPAVYDTDADGYGDGDEVRESTDPLDPSSVIYTGGWPYYAKKGSIAEPTETLAAVGVRIPRVRTLVDQFGEEVDPYDFYNADKPVVIDISAQWCFPCQQVTSWLGGEEDPLLLGTIWPAGPDVIARGDVYWLTILAEDKNHLIAHVETPAEWAAAFPSDAVAVLADDEYALTDFVGITSWPTLVLLEPDLTVSLLDRTDPFAAVLIELAARYPE